MELWEYNAVMRAYTVREDRRAAETIATGYYTAYYVNGGKKAKPPSELIARLNRPKQTPEEGLLAIERVKNLEKGGKYV